MALALAAVCLVGGGACYALAFHLRPGRTAQAYAALGLLLVLAGTRISLPAPAAAAVWTARSQSLA